MSWSCAVYIEAGVKLDRNPIRKRCIIITETIILNKFSGSVFLCCFFFRLIHDLSVIGVLISSVLSSFGQIRRKLPDIWKTNVQRESF